MRPLSACRRSLAAVALVVPTFVLVGLAGPCPAQSDVVSFRREIPPVGRSYRVMQSLRVTLMGKELTTAALSRIRDVKVMERDTDRLTALRIEYREAMVQSGIRFLESGPECVDGKAYVARFGADGVAIVPARGGAPSDEEMNYIRWDLGGKAGVGALARYLNGRTLRIDTDVPDPAGFLDGLRPALMRMGLSGVLNFKVRFHRVRTAPGGERLASFRLAFTVGTVRFLASTTMQLTGELQVRVPSGEPAKLSLDGRLQTVVRKKTRLRKADIRSGYFNATQSTLPSLDLKIAGPGPRRSTPPERRPASARSRAGTPAEKLAATLSWPRERVVDGARIVMHQPQVSRWSGDRLEARMAVQFTPPDDSRPLVGTIVLAAGTRTNLLTRRVTLAGLRITSVRFPARRGRAEADLAHQLERVLPTGPFDVALDRILAYERAVVAPADVRRLPAAAEPLRVLTAAAPAVLVRIDGPPDWVPIPFTGLETVVNTPWDILRESETGRIYLRAGMTWQTAKGLEGPWKAADDLPRAFRLVPRNHPRAGARRARMADTEGAPAVSVTIAYGPAELIDLEGPLTLTAVEGTALLYARNTSRDLFLHLGSKRFYLLASGRWFAAPALVGPWEAVEKLPDAFGRIPRGHACGRVRFAVPGTPEATEAVMLAHIPVRTVLSRREAVLAVSYDGAPDFRKIEGSDLTFAFNSPFDVVCAANRYYCCFRAAWFTADAPGGPWHLADAVPAAIHAMPPTSPVYRLSYVHVGDATTEHVAFRYLAGYLGCFVSDKGTLVHGTGVATPPYIRKAVYYGWPWTFGMPIRYNPLSGVFGLRSDQRSPYAAFEVRAGYPASRDDSRGPAPSPYAAWGDVVVGGQEKWRRAGHHTTAAGVEPGFDPTRGGASPTAPARAATDASRHDLIVGQDGVVYKDMPSGWYKFENDTWTRIPGRPVRSGGKMHFLGIEEEANRRKEAEQRFNVFASWQEGM